MPILFDSSIYITALRQGTVSRVLLQRRAQESPLWLTSVVLEELCEGANPADRRVLEKLEHGFERANRVLVPNLGDWGLAGKVLASVAQKYGYEKIGRARLTNDALIATSTARKGITVISTKSKHFALLAESCPAQWHTRVLLE